MSAFVGTGIRFKRSEKRFYLFSHLVGVFRVDQIISKSANEWPILVSFQSESNRNFTEGFSELNRSIRAPNRLLCLAMPFARVRGVGGQNVPKTHMR